MAEAKKRSLEKSGVTEATNPVELFKEVRTLILTGRDFISRNVNVTLTLLYWKIGERIREHILHQRRAGYGEEIVVTLSQQLQSEFGTGYSRYNLSRMIQFAESFPDEQMVTNLSQHLSWSHFLAILPLRDQLQRDFYAEMCRVEGWSVRTLREKISGMLYERTALSKKPEILIEREIRELREEDKLTPDLVFRDPYFLDFLGLKDAYSERDLESAIVRDLESFLLEIGAGFAFVARQKRIQLDGDDYYLDLLFYHRRLRRLVAVELKLRDFEPGDKGQMELYLRWLDRYERQVGEEAPLGLILCAGKKEEQIELLELEKSGIRVASYWMELLPRDQLQRKLHEALILARERFARRSLVEDE